MHSIPNSASVLQLFHFAQMKMSGNFQAFNYNDVAINRMTYGTSQPPKYNLTKITVPTAIFYSNSDEVSNSTDVLFLHTKLRNVTELYRVPIKDFRHIDFIYSRFVRDVINEKVISTLQMHNQYTKDTR